MSQIDEITFLRKLQRLLEEGDFVATYKFALLQALADLSVEKDAAADGTLYLGLEELGEKFVEYYWPQARPYKNGVALLQNMGRQAAIVNRVAEAQSWYDVSLAGARRKSRDWRRLVNRVTRVVEDMPLWKLHVVSGGVEGFLYRPERFDGVGLWLEPGVAKCFRAFHPFIVNMVRGAWISHLLRIRQNQEMLGDQGDLSEFLFGSERRPLDQYRAVLRDHQDGRCFYCGRHVPPRKEALDHFIPWSRYPVDLGHNFVFADAVCNKQKRDYLAHTDHLEKWSEQNVGHADELANQFDQRLLRHDLERTWKVTYWAYEQAELANSRVWGRAEEFSSLGSEWAQGLVRNVGVGSAGRDQL